TSVTRELQARGVPSCIVRDAYAERRPSEAARDAGIASGDAMARARFVRTDALDRRAAEPAELDELRARARRHLLLGFVGVLALILAFAQTCWHARDRYTPLPEDHVLPQVPE